jgi:hypothetical protein
MENIVTEAFERQETRFICKFLVNYHAPGSGSAFPIRIQDRQMNADPSEFGSTILRQTYKSIRQILTFGKYETLPV